MAAATVTTTDRKTLHEEAQYYLALSVMVYLYSDLRCLSATGFTTFPFESIALLKSDNLGSQRRLTGEIIMNALAELRLGSRIKDKEGLYDQRVNKKGKEHDSDS